MPSRPPTLTYIRDLGPGGFGIAKLFKTRSGELVCVKEVHYPSDVETRNQVLNEVRSMELSCKHPNVVTYMDSWVMGSRLCIMMEYCSNGSLNTLIMKHARRVMHFPLIKITHYLQELADALRFCHEDLRMVHRDIKPDNIFIDGLGSLKLGDFGMSKTLETTTAMCATFCGTPHFLSPEQHVGREYSFPTDIWALGCVFYQLVELREPWQGCHTFEALSRRILKQPEFSSLHGYPPMIIDTALWMLQVDAHLRPTASMLVEHLAPRAPPPVYKTAVEKIVEDAKILAATRIQTSFRRSAILRPLDRKEVDYHFAQRKVAGANATTNATTETTTTEAATAKTAAKTVAKTAAKTAAEEAAEEAETGDHKTFVVHTAEHVAIEDPVLDKTRGGVRLRKLEFPNRVVCAPSECTVRNAQTIQRAVRISLNRRRRDVAPPLPDNIPPAPKPRPKLRPRADALPARIHQLATPRARRAAYEVPAYVPHRHARQAWL